MNSKEKSNDSSWDFLLDKTQGIKTFNEEKLKTLKIKPYENTLIFSRIYDKTLSFLDKKIGKNIRILFVSLLFFTIIPAISFLIISIIENTRILPGNNEGFFEDYVNWTHLIVFGLVVFVIKNFYNKVSIFFQKIVNTIDIEKYSFKEFNDFVQESKNKFQLKGNIFYYILVIGGFLFFLLITFYSQLNRSYDIWHSYNYPLGISFYAVYNFVTIVIILPIIIYHFFVIVGIIKEYTKTLGEKKVLIIRPHNSENAYNFGICGEISLSFYYIALVPILFIIVGILRQVIFTSKIELAFIGYLPIYIIGLIIVFFYPILTVHVTMKEIKERELKKIRNIYNKNYNLLYNINESKTIKDDFESLDKLEKIGNIYNDFSNIKEWPLNIDIVKQLLGSVLTSIIIPVGFILFESFA